MRTVGRMIIRGGFPESERAEGEEDEEVVLEMPCGEAEVAVIDDDDDDEVREEDGDGEGLVRGGLIVLALAYCVRVGVVTVRVARPRLEEIQEIAPSVCCGEEDEASEM